jgi:acetyl esterase/lipase
MISRRNLLAALSAFPLVSPALMAPGRAFAGSAVTLKLWPGSPPGGGGPQGPTQISAKGAASHVETPNLQVFAPAQPNGKAVLIAGGGGYKRIELENESYPAAHWLNDRGITAFVLTYRLPPEGWTDGALAPLQDAQRAIRLMRAKARDFQLDPQKIGVLGFSAGGHLMGMAAARSNLASYAPVDAVDDLSARPDFAALAYPVITLQPPYDNTATRRSLVGDHPTPEASAEWSVETHVRAGCPPVFLVQADDDPIANPENTRIMEKACRLAGVPVERHALPSGGHGFGMGMPGAPSADWPVWYEAWLHNHT